MKKVALHTLGCKLNFAETSTIGRQFVRRGYDVVGFDQPSDVYVLNTCSVTERADKECRQIIRRVRRHSPDAYIAVVGCYAQLQPEEIGSIEGVDLVLGAKEKFNIFDHAGNFLKRSVPQVFVSCIDEAVDFDEASSSEVGGRTRAFLKVQDGCDFNCAFCTIPLARGGSRSAPVEDLVRQATHLSGQGYKEIVLTGVNVGDYGKKTGSSLLDLLHALDAVDGLQRIRISSIEPNLLTREMVDFILSSEKFCNHFHIPLQSGSDTILSRMRRRYRTRDYRSLVEYILMQDSGAAIGVDVICGFPGETDELFAETFAFLVDLPVSYLHVFTYSERPNTPALESSNPVEPRIRFRRSEMLRMLSQKKRHTFHAAFLGKTMAVLYESEMRPGRAAGLTSNYIRVETLSHAPLCNEIHDATITAVVGDGCLGRLAGPNTVPVFHQGEFESTDRATAFSS